MTHPGVSYKWQNCVQFWGSSTTIRLASGCQLLAFTGLVDTAGSGWAWVLRRDSPPATGWGVGRSTPGFCAECTGTGHVGHGVARHERGALFPLLDGCIGCTYSLGKQVSITHLARDRTDCCGVGEHDAPDRSRPHWCDRPIPLATNAPPSLAGGCRCEFHPACALVPAQCSAWHCRNR